MNALDMMLLSWAAVSAVSVAATALVVVAEVRHVPANTYELTTTVPSSDASRDPTKPHRTASHHRVELNGRSASTTSPTRGVTTRVASATVRRIGSSQS